MRERDKERERQRERERERERERVKLTIHSIRVSGNLRDFKLLVEPGSNFTSFHCLRPNSCSLIYLFSFCQWEFVCEAFRQFIIRYYL